MSTSLPSSITRVAQGAKLFLTVSALFATLVAFDPSRAQPSEFVPQVRNLETKGETTPNANDEHVGVGVDHFVYKPQTHRDLPILPGKNIFIPNPEPNKEILEHNAQFLPQDMVIHTFNHTSMTQSVKMLSQELEKKVNVTGAWEAYQLLRPWAYRADLWRLMILWSEGGIYLDGKIKLQAPVEEWALLDSNQSISLCNDGFSKWSPAGRPEYPKIRRLYNGFLSAKKHSPVLLEAIKILIDNVQQRKYPGIEDQLPVKKEPWIGSLAITGPVVLALAATAPHIPPNSVHKTCIFYHAKTGAYKVPHKPNKEKTGCLFVFDQKEHKKVKTAGKAHKGYWGLFKERAVYCDDEGAKGDPDCDLSTYAQVE